MEGTYLIPIITQMDKKMSKRHLSKSLPFPLICNASSVICQNTCGAVSGLSSLLQCSIRPPAGQQHGLIYCNVLVRLDICWCESFAFFFRVSWLYSGSFALPLHTLESVQVHEDPCWDICQNSIDPIGDLGEKRHFYDTEISLCIKMSLHSLALPIIF